MRAVFSRHATQVRLRLFLDPHKDSSGTTITLDPLMVIVLEMSGTEDVYKLYAESFLGRDYLRCIQEGARQLLTTAFAKESQV